MKQEYLNKNDKCIILVYFGTRPNYFNLYINSCKLNQSFDFHIYGDSFDDKREDNIFYHYLTFSAFKEKIKTTLGFAPSLNSVYKICDFKPMYGDLFQNDLKQYLFWGFSDCDLIYGKIDNILDESIFKKYDKVLTRGHLSFFKNNQSMNKLYTKKSTTDFQVDYNVVYRDSKNYSFDEWNGIKILLDEYKIPYFDSFVFDDIRVKYPYFIPTSDNAIKKHRYRIYYEWDNGRLYRRLSGKQNIKQEIIYIHLQKRKMHLFNSNLDHYYIIPNRFCDSVDASALNVGNRKDLFDYAFKRMKNKIMRVFRKK